MNEFFSQFHFLRPLWLLALIPCLLIIIRLWHQHHTQGSWQKVIAPELLQHLLHEKAQRTSRLPLILLLTGWVAGCIALAGPVWQKMPVPVSKSQQPLVVVVDLSYYMLAEDLKPDRLTRTRYKLHDLFRLRKDGVSAIVSYAGSAHAVAPLTDDSRTLSNLVNAMNPGIMPVQGNKPEEGIKQAKLLLEQGSNESGDILLITGNVTDSQAASIHDLLDKTGIRLSVLGVGTEQGAPIPLPDGGYLKNQQGTIVIPQLNKPALTELATGNGGQYRDMTVNDSDLKALLPEAGLKDDVLIVERDFDQWHDAGYWLLLLILLLALPGFRRGWLTAVMLCILLPATPDAQALDWQEGWRNLWQTADQQGQKALNDSDPKTAASLFDHAEWKGEALFQSGNFEEAAKAFAQANTASSIYNKGNALAKAGKLQEALDAYDEALQQQPDFADAKANRKLVEDLLKQQQEQQKQDQKNQDQQNKDQNQNDQKDSDNQDQQNQDQQNQDQQSQDKQNQDQQSQDQQSQDKQNQDSQQSRENQSQEQQSQQQQSDQQQSDQQEGDKQNQNAEEQEQQNQNQQEQSAQEQEQEQKEQQTSQPSKQQQSEEQPKDEEQAEQQAQIESDTVQSPEKQAVESWLRTIPDDPGGLLRRKFLQQQQQRQGRN